MGTTTGVHRPYEEKGPHDVGVVPSSWDLPRFMRKIAEITWGSEAYVICTYQQCQGPNRVIVHPMPHYWVNGSHGKMGHWVPFDKPLTHEQIGDMCSLAASFFTNIYHEPKGKQHYLRYGRESRISVGDDLRFGKGHRVPVDGDPIEPLTRGVSGLSLDVEDMEDPEWKATHEACGCVKPRAVRSSKRLVTTDTAFALLTYLSQVVMKRDSFKDAVIECASGIATATYHTMDGIATFGPEDGVSIVLYGNRVALAKDPLLLHKLAALCTTFYHNVVYINPSDERGSLTDSIARTALRMHPMANAGFANVLVYHPHVPVPENHFTVDVHKRVY